MNHAVSALLIFAILIGGGPAGADIEYDDEGISLIDEEIEALAEPKAEPEVGKKRPKRPIKKNNVKNKKRRKAHPKSVRQLKTKIDRADFEDAPPDFENQEFSWERTPRGKGFFREFGDLELTQGKLGGEIQLEGRAFQEVDNRTLTADQAAALLLRGELPYESKGGDWEAKIKGFGRFDALDDGRNVVFPEEVWISHTRGFLQAKLGFQTFGWTQMDLFSPAELLNSVNFDSEVENLEKIGEFALTLKMKLAFGFLEAIYMPFVWEPHFPGPKSRFNILEFGKEMGEPAYVKKDGTVVEGRQFHQFALMFSRSLGDADLNLFMVDQVDRRTPEIVDPNDAADPGDTIRRPVFFPITSLGLSVVYAMDETLLKLESVRRLVTNPNEDNPFGEELKKRSHSIAAAGVEREFEAFGKQVTAFAEYQSLFGISDQTSEIDKQRISVFQNDVALGFRIGFNDIRGREIRVLANWDLDRTDQVLGSVTYKQRMGEKWTVQLGARFIHAPPAARTITGFEDQGPQTVPVGLERFYTDNYGFVLLTRFF